MAFIHGKNTTVMLGAVDISSYLDSIDLSVSADVADTTMFKSTWKSGVAGILQAQVGFSGLYDQTDETLEDAFIAAVPGVLTFCPGGGTVIGDPARCATVFDVSQQTSAPVGGMLAVSGSFTADAAVGLGRVLHPLGEDTNTTTGASYDGLAATSTGWTASLHVTVVDGGSWVVTIEDDTATGFDGTPATIATFTAATTVTSQVLHSAAADTAVRRYIRYKATRTGGAAGNGITYFLAFARNK